MTEVENLMLEPRYMIDNAKLRLWRALETGRRGLRAPVEDILVAGLVAAPFAATFGIWLSWLTWWPNPVIWVATAAMLGAAKVWIAGRGVGVAEGGE